MISSRVAVVLILPLLWLVTGCAGVRHSYQSSLDKRYEKPVIELAVGERIEVLSIGNGFPGWWGVYPGTRSLDSDVASISCESGRGLIPFREPGVIFGGETCYLDSHKLGAAWLLTGDRHALFADKLEIAMPKVADENHFPPEPTQYEHPNFRVQWILVKVVPAKKAR